MRGLCPDDLRAFRLFPRREIEDIRVAGINDRHPLAHISWLRFAVIGGNMFQQTLNPAGSLWLSVLISMVPLVALLYMLAVLRLTAWLATIVGGVITFLLGVLVWHAPAGD